MKGRGCPLDAPRRGFWGKQGPKGRPSWVFSSRYDRAKQLATAAKEAGDKAAAEPSQPGKKGRRGRKPRSRPIAAARAKAKAAAVRVGGKIEPPIKMNDVGAGVPGIAQNAGVTGSVIIEATIGADGRIIGRESTALDPAARSGRT